MRLSLPAGRCAAKCEKSEYYGERSALGGGAGAAGAKPDPGDDTLWPQALRQRAHELEPRMPPLAELYRRYCTEFIQTELSCQDVCNRVIIYRTDAVTERTRGRPLPNSMP